MIEKNKKIKQINDLLASHAYAKALNKLRPLINANDPIATGIFGLVHQLGLGVEVDGVKAVDYYKKALKLGDATSAHNLGTIYKMGMPGILPDLELSKYYYRKAKEMGAQFASDNFYE